MDSKYNTNVKKTDIRIKTYNLLLFTNIYIQTRLLLAFYSLFAGHYGPAKRMIKTKNYVISYDIQHSTLDKRRPPRDCMSTEYFTNSSHLLTCQTVSNYLLM